MKKEIGFIIESVSSKKNSILIRLYSPNFKNSKETYPIFNIPLTSLNINGDVKKQIADILSHHYDNIVESETDIDQKYKIIESLIDKQIIIEHDDFSIETNNPKPLSIRDLEINPIPLESLNINFIN